MIRRPPGSTRTYTHVPYPTLFRSAMIGKAERVSVAIEAIRRHRSAYLMAVGGSAYLVSKAIRSARVIGFEDLGMEAIYEFDVQDMPVTVAVDSKGTSCHHTGPRQWTERIATVNLMPVWNQGCYNSTTSREVSR